MSDLAENTIFLKDSDKTDLGHLDLFDRVINVKLTVSETVKNESGQLYIANNEYIIRSDFEIYYPNLLKSVTENKYSTFSSSNNNYIIRKCQLKPSLKIQYKRVSMTVPVEIDLFVSNFYMFDKDGKMLKTFNNSNYKLTKVEIAMGYFGQFNEFFKSKYTSGITVDSLFDFDEENLKAYGITKLTIDNIPYIQTDALPPDLTAHIHGFVGNLYSARLINTNIKDTEKYDDIVEDSTKIVKWSEKSSKTFLEHTLFEVITKNWVCEGSLPKETNIKLLTSTTFAVDGVLSDRDAEEYGVHVFLSDGAKAWAKEWDKSHNIKQEITFAKANTALEKLNVIKSEFGMNEGFSSITLSVNGNILLYKDEEVNDPENMLKGTAMEKVFNNNVANTFWKNKLPAVYNITTDAICTVTCPFFFFLEPFQKFYFKSRYALSGMVSYLAKFNASMDEYFALWQTVSFATVENINECEIICTGKPK